MIHVELFYIEIADITSNTEKGKAFRVNRLA